MSAAGGVLERGAGGVPRLRLLLAAWLALLLGLPWFLSTSARADAPPPAGNVRVVGGHLERDGVPWVPRGATFLAVLAPDGVSAAMTNTAASWFGPDELAAARSWGMDVLRFQVSERGLDPQDTRHTTAYVDRVVSAVTLARSSGFSVILSMQDQGLAGGDRSPQPGAATARAWDGLAAEFGDDTGVLFELFNEPQNDSDAAGWQIWRDGSGTTAKIGHQALVSRIRATGAVNVLLADGARYARTLAGLPELDDPLGQTAYAVHPYLNDPIRTPDQWDAGFGYLTDRSPDPLPVVATEWNAASDSSTCRSDWGQNAPLLVDYLRTHGIGLVGWPFDAPGWLVSDAAWTPTVLTGFSCGTPHLGAGTLIRDEFVRDDPPSLRLEMQDRSGAATARLAWSGPGVAAGIVPSSRLHP